METLNCHSNESSWPLKIKNIPFEEDNVLNKYAKFQLMVSEKIFEYFFENLPFMLPFQPIKLSDLDKSRMKRGRLLKKHFCKKFKYLKCLIRNCQFPLFPL